MARESRDVSMRPAAADTTRPLGGYRLSIRCSASGFERSYAALTWRVNESTIAARSAFETVTEDEQAANNRNAASCNRMVVAGRRGWKVPRTIDSDRRDRRGVTTVRQ